jgi:drug/metabolite transporter (DMT)-like permease
MNFCWAAVYSAYKVIGQDLPLGSVGTIVTLRFGMAALFLLIAWPWLPGLAPKGWDLVKTLVMGWLLCVAGQRLQVYGNQLGSAGNSAVLMAIEPLLTSLGAAIFLREYIGPRRWLGFVLAMFGVGLLNGVWRTDFQWTGLAASLIFISSFICESAYSIVGKGVVARSSVTKMLALSLAAGTAVNLLIDGRATMEMARGLPLEAWILLVGLAFICTAVGYSIWFVVIRDGPVNLAALTIFSQSVFGVIIAAVWIGEKPHRGQFLGSLAIVAGLIVGFSRQIRPRIEVISHSSDRVPSGSPDACD